MKIGVVTVPDSSNFGAYLQAYAMKSVLEGMGHEVYFIRTRNKQYVIGLFYSPRLFVSSLFKPPIIGLKRYWWGIRKYKYFCKAWERFKMLDHFHDIELDLIILGSDEIWNVTTTAFRQEIFYGIGMKNVITYAVSMGKAGKQDIERYPNIFHAIKDIDNILVRDVATQAIVRDIKGKEPGMVCDPTILADKSVFDRVCNNPYLTQNRYLLVYSYGLDEIIKRHINTFAHKHGLKIVSVCFYFEWCEYNVMCDPLEFSQVVKDAEYVITTTFHGSIFSFLNKRKFISIPSGQKVIDILQKVGLEERIVEGNCSYEQFERTLVGEIDYTIVDEKIQLLRKDSLIQLEDCIKDKINGYLQ